MSTIYAVANDTTKVVGVTLSADGVAVNLTAQSITCYLTNMASGVVTSITGLTGSSTGAVSTPIVAANLIAGNWLMEWQVINGLTYPEKASDRPLLIIRTDQV